jgi:hypothetical protein
MGERRLLYLDGVPQFHTDGSELYEFDPEVLAEMPTEALVEELRRRGLAYAAESRTDRNGNQVVPVNGPWFGWIVSLSAERASDGCEPQ